MRKLGSICRNDETAGHFHACGLCLRLPDPTRAPVTLDFIQLVSIDRKITSGLPSGQRTAKIAPAVISANMSQSNMMPYDPLGRPSRDSAAGHTSRPIMTEMSKNKSA